MTISDYINVSYNLIANGSYIQGVKYMYDYVMGPWWLLIILVLCIFGSNYITKSEGVAAVVGIAGSAAMIKYSLIPTYLHPIPYIIIVFALAFLLYKAFGGKD